MISIPITDLKPGDMMYRSLKDVVIFDHWGNFAGTDVLGRFWVFEHGKGGSCRLSLFDEFSKGYDAKCERISDEHRPIAVNRMRELLASPKDYDVLGFNCEHASRYVASGVKESKQVITVVLILLFGLITFLALRNKLNL